MANLIKIGNPVLVVATLQLGAGDALQCLMLEQNTLASIGSRITQVLADGQEM